MTEPRITVLPRVRVRGWNGEIPLNVPTYPVLPLKDALEGQYRGETMLLQYGPRPDDEDVESFPRLNKPSLGYFLSNPEDEPTLNCALIDVDYENHGVPPDGWREGVIARSPFDETGWYFTEHGLRLVYVPHEPVPLRYAQDYLDQLRDKLHAAGIETDENARDWTRLSKAPRAFDLDLPRNFDNLTPLTWHPTRLADSDPSHVGPIVERSIEEHLIGCESQSITRGELAPLKKLDARLAEDIYQDRLTAPKGHRHALLTDAALKITKAYETDDPAIPYSLLIKTVLRMGQEKTPQELLRICQWACAQVSGTRIQRQEDYDEVLRTTADYLDITADEVGERIIIDAGNEFFVWDEERLEYSTGYTHEKQLLGALQRHCPRLTWKYTDGDKPASSTIIHRDLATVADTIYYTYDPDQAGYDKTEYAFYKPICRVDRALTPRFDPDIDQWLRLMAGSDYPRLARWLAAYPVLTRPLCALYFSGRASIGKQMLAMGLARIHSRISAFVPYAEMLSDFNELLKMSPLIYADEKVAQDSFNLNDSSVFRRLVGNNLFELNAKNRAKAYLIGYPRVLITANNADALGIREDLDAADLEAIRIRIGFIENHDDHVQQFLEAYAEREGFHTSREATDSWVAGGRIAEHVLYLASQAQPEDWDSRYLVVGWESKLTRQLATNHGRTGTVAETIALAMQRPGRAQDAVDWEAGKIFVHRQLLAEHWARIKQMDERPPNSDSLLKALKSLSEDTTARRSIYEGSSRRQLTYYEIDSEVIARLSEERGLASYAEVMAAAQAGKGNESEHETILEFQGAQNG